MVTIPLWLCITAAVVFVIAVAVAAVAVRLLFHNPVGLPDKGHRCFRVADEETHLALLEVCGDISGIREAMTFEPAPTIQTLLDDGNTVIIRADDKLLPSGAGPNFMSVVVEGRPGDGAPMAAAKNAQAIFAKRGIELHVHSDPLPDLGEKTMLLTCDKFQGWSLLVRLRSTQLGKPQKLRKIKGPDGIIVKLMRKLPA